MNDPYTGVSLDANTTTNTVNITVTNPNICPGCGRCKQCGSPAPAPQPWWAPSYYPSPWYPVIWGNVSNSYGKGLLDFSSQITC